MNKKHPQQPMLKIVKLNIGKMDMKYTLDQHKFTPIIVHMFTR